MTKATANQLLIAEAGVVRWVLDTQASSVRFAHKAIGGMVTVKGVFTGLAGEGVIGIDGTVTGSLRIDARSIYTKNKRRDEHLRSKAFLDVDQHPDITVVVTSASVDGDDMRLHAELIVKGIREPIGLIARVDQATDQAVTATVDAKIDRIRFGLSWNPMGMLGGPTSVTVNAVFNRTH